MKFTYSWLKEYVDIKLKPEELAQKLTMAGLEIESLSNTCGEWIFEAEVTTNRPDWLSIIGITREVAAVTGTSLRGVPRPEHWIPFTGSGTTKQSPRSKEIASLASFARNDGFIQIQDDIACPRYTGRVITNVKVGPSPEWLIKRLKSIGLRPVNNIVDITNFVLFETGQPLHAFDFDKLAGSKIIVRRAKDNEEIISIDNVKRKLNPNILVIADEKSTIAVAGVMGGMATEVGAGTKTILLESAYFNPAMIRKASRFLALSSDSSYRFERGVDLVGVKTASERATGLIIKIAGGEAGKLVDAGKKTLSQQKIFLSRQKVNDLLGVEISQKDIIKILTSLGIKNIGRGTARRAPAFVVPSWRNDLKKEIDLIEEVVRIYGYDKIPSVAPKGIDDKDRAIAPRQFEFQALLRNALAGFGLNEVITYSLVDKISGEEIAIKNPLSPELAVLRTDLYRGVLSVVKRNLNRNINDIKLFEIGPVYSQAGLDKKEESHLAVCLSGVRSDNWQDGPKAVDFYYLKGIVEALFLKLGVKDCQINHSQNNVLSFSESADIKVAGDIVGFFGKAKKEFLGKIDIDKDCFICELNLDKLMAYANRDKKFSQLPKFPAVYRDISTLVKLDVSSGDIVNVIKAAASNIVKDVKLFDVYTGQQIPKGYKSLVYRLTYQSQDKTLADIEVEPVHSKIIIALKERLGVQIR